MTNPIPLNLAVEDDLSEAVLQVMLRQAPRRYAVGTCYARGGFGYLRKTINGFNNAAKGTPFLVLTDLDVAECPPTLIKEWLRQPRHPNLLLRIAVREVESWLLADRDAFAKFLGIRVELIPNNADRIADPKKFLIGLTRKSPFASLRKDIVPPQGSNREQGPDYNGRLSWFVWNRWRARRAKAHSPSLRRTVDRLSRFTPHFGGTEETQGRP